MTPSYRYEMIGGDSLPIRLRYTTAGAPYDFTGSIVSVIFKWLGREFVLSSEDDQVKLGPDGWIKAVAPAEITKDWPSGKQVAYQVKVQDALGEVRTILTGGVDVTP